MTDREWAIAEHDRLLAEINDNPAISETEYDEIMDKITLEEILIMSGPPAI